MLWRIHLRRGRRDERRLAREVFEDMRGEQLERLASIRDELLAIKSSEFWEISDRGVNFDYLTPERKKHMMRFFSWFGDRLPPVSIRESAEMPEVIPTGGSIHPRLSMPDPFQASTDSINELTQLQKPPK